MADYSDIYQEAGDATGLDPDLLRAKDFVESGYDRFAVSPAGAKGVAQLMDVTAKEEGVTDPYEPKQSIHGGARYLRKQFDTFRGDPYTALAAYNAGANGDFNNPETRDYVEKVANKWDDYRAEKWARQGRQQQQAAPTMSFDDLVPADKPMSFDDLLPGAKNGQPPVAKPSAPEQTLERNKPYVAANAQNFVTPLGPVQEARFRQWVADNKVPFNPDDKTPDYDMRGYWQASNNPNAWRHLQDMKQIPGDVQPGGTKVDPNDGRPHFPDWWKTPYHQTFSNESQWADRSTAPRWTHDDKLVTPDGKVVFDDRAQKPGQAPEAKDAGWLETAKQAALAPIRGAAQTAQSITGTPQASDAQSIKAAEPMAWSDLKDPVLLGKKALYGFLASSPEMAGYAVGAVAGGGIETPVGLLATGPLGAGIAHAAVSLGPVFRTELDQTPKDPDGAFERAMVKTGVGASATAASFALFGFANPFKSGLKNLMFQAFGVQPAVSGAEHAVTNVMDGKPATEGLADSYPATVLGTIVPAAAMHGTGLLLPKPRRPVGQETTPDQTTPPPDQQAADQTPVSPTDGNPAGVTLKDNYDPNYPGPDGTGPGPTPPTGPEPPTGTGPDLTPSVQPPPGPGPTPPVQPPAGPGADPVADANKVLSTIVDGGDPTSTPTPSPPPTTAPAGPTPTPTPEPVVPPPVTPVTPVTPPGPPSPESTPPPVESTPAPAPAPPKSGDYVMLDPAELNVDPARFQFKASDPEKGVTGVLRGSDRWEATLADPITAWQDLDGKYWVANGHQRTDLANRAVAAGQQDVRVPAKIYREADGYTPGYMRALGAYQNIAQGSGTAIDAAKIMREVGKAPTEYNLPTLPPKSALTIQAKGLSKLSDEAFGAVVNDVVPAAYAAHIGDLISDPAQQMAAIRVLHRAEPGNAEQARMMVTDIRNIGFQKEQESGQGVIVLGDDDFIKSIVPERAKVLDSALKLLRRNKTVYRAAVEGEDTLTAAGNQLDREGNVKARTENEQLIDHIDRSAQTKGPLSDALTAAARDVADGKPIANAVAGFIRQARQDHASGSQGGVERGVDHERTEPSPESGDAGRIDDAGQDGLLAPKVPLFSPLTRAVDGLTQAKGTGEQMLAVLAKQAGVKPDEIRWTGLGEWLKGQTSVTKAQIQDYMRANALNIEEVTLGGDNSDVVKKAMDRVERAAADLHTASRDLDNQMAYIGGRVPIDGEYLYWDEVARGLRAGTIAPDHLPKGAIRDSAENYLELDREHTAAEIAQHEAIEKNHREQVKYPKYSSYTLPGGKDYREMLITMPPKPADPLVAGIASHGREMAHLATTPEGIAGLRKWNSAMAETLKGHSDQEIIAAAKAALTFNPEQPYRSGHWDEPNVLAHVRLAEHTAPDGKRVLLVEEVQSDWHQAGRKGGYMGEITKLPDGWTVHEFPNGRADNRFLVQTPDGHHFSPHGHATREAAIAQAVEMLNHGAHSSVPNAPFKTTWPSLVMKRMVKFAVDNGFDRVAWAPGDVQADRYSLARQVSGVGWTPSKGTLHIRKLGEEQYYHDERMKDVTAANLADHVGKEAAEKMIAKGPDERGVHFLEGDDLKVGGSGMRGFYDRQLPMETNKILKPFGGKVGQSEVHTGKPDRGSLKPDAQAISAHVAEWKTLTATIENIEAMNMPWQDKADLTAPLREQLDALHAKMIDETYARAIPKQTVHSFDITPQIRKVVADQGLGLFAPKGKINSRNQGDMFGDQAKPRTEVIPPKANPAQLDMFGRNDAAIQAQAKRDQEGRGALLAKTDQKKADHGLFADRMEGQGTLGARPAARSELGTFTVTDNKGRPAAGRDLTAEVVIRPGESPQVAAAKFVITRGRLTAHEYLTVVDRDGGRVIHAGTNDLVDRVGIDPRALTGRPTDSVTVHHNHPGGMGFSPQDMMMLWHPAMGHMVAHSEGDVLIAALGDRARGRRDATTPGGLPGAIAAAHKFATVQATQLIQRGWEMGDHWPPSAAATRQGQKSFYDVVARILHANGIIDYISTRAMDPNVESMLIRELTNAGYNPREIASATRVYSQDEAHAALAQPRSGYAKETGAHESDRPAAPVDAGSRTADLAGGQPGRGARTGSVDSERGAAGAKADRRQDLGSVGARSGTTTPVTPPPPQPAASFISKARDLYENARIRLNVAMTAHFTPLAGGTKRAMDIAVNLANALRGVNYQFKLLDNRILKMFPDPKHRNAMGKAMDETSVLEQMISQLRENNAAQGTLGQPMMSAAQMAQAEITMRQTWTAQGKGIETLPPDQRAMVNELGRLGDQVWQRMKGRGMVNASAEGLPYYFARMVLQRDAAGNIIKPKQGGTGRDIHDFGGNLTSSGPMSRKHLTAADTLAAAQAALGDPNAFLVQDIRVVAQALNRNERAIAGKDFIDAIKRIGVANGTNMIFHGNVPHGSNPADYFTIDGHPSFRQWTGSGFQALHVSKEFEGPIKAVLTQPGSQVYQGAMKLKSASMTAIMWSPLMHLGVEIGRAFPLMPGRILTGKVFGDGNRLRNDPGYMQRATDDGLAPIGQSWREDAASIAEQSDVNRKPPGLIGKAGAAIGNLHQKVLWDNVFKLQVGIYDNLRTTFMNKGFDQKVAGVMAAHEANRFAGALPQENLSRWANQTSNLLLFSRSFTLGNLGVMKDMFNGMPRQTKAVIEQLAGPQVAKDAAKVLQRKAIGAVIFDVGLMYMANTIFQQGAAMWDRTPTMGLGPAAQSVLDDWKDQARAALKATGEDWNPTHLSRLLPQGNNEPGKTDRAYLGKDEDGRGVYLRTSFGKVGEEFLNWPFSPFKLLDAKLSPQLRPLIEIMMGKDGLGRQIYNPHPETFGEILANIGSAVAHVAKSQGPVDQVVGAYDLGKQLTGHGDPAADWLIPAARTVLPMTGLGQISRGYPGPNGPERGFNNANRESETWHQGQAMPTARQQFKDGHPEQAYQTLVDAGVQRDQARRLVRSMNESSAAAAAERYAAKHLSDAERDRRSHLTGASH